jgi:hypothetical protein
MSMIYCECHYIFSYTNISEEYWVGEDEIWIKSVYCAVCNWYYLLIYLFIHLFIYLFLYFYIKCMYECMHAWLFICRKFSESLLFFQLNIRCKFIFHITFYIIKEKGQWRYITSWTLVCICHKCFSLSSCVNARIMQEYLTHKCALCNRHLIQATVWSMICYSSVRLQHTYCEKITEVQTIPDFLNRRFLMRLTIKRV